MMEASDRNCAECGAEVQVAAAFCFACGISVRTGLPDEKHARLPFWPPPWGDVWTILKQSLRQVFARHGRGAVEVALESRSPQEAHVAPWAFSRVLITLLGAYLILIIIFDSTSNAIVVPIALLIGAAIVPVSAALFIFECNLPRNITLYRFSVLLAAGGFLSLIGSVVLYSIDPAGLSAIGAMAAPFIEEPAKLAIVILLTRRYAAPWVLNGAVFGAAVGAGFAVLETSGYLFVSFFNLGNISAVSDLAFQRGFLAFGTHVSWTAILAAALWSVRDGRPFSWDMLTNKSFAIPFSIVVAAHLVWNSPIGQSAIPVLIAIALMGVVMLLGYITMGQRQFLKSIETDTSAG